MDRIRFDLKSLARARQLALGAYLGLLALVLTALAFVPQSVQPSGTAWAWAMGCFVVGAAWTTGLALGMPLVHGWAFSGGLALGVGLMCGGLGTATWVQHDGAAMAQSGLECFVGGTVISGLAMLVLGAVSGRLWRRFPDPGFALALATTLVGVMALHVHCGDFSGLHLFAFHLTPLAGMYALARVLTRLRLRLLEG